MAAYPSVKRTVSGYNLDLLVEEAKAVEAGDCETLNLAKLIFGSEGTIAVITEATVPSKLCPKQRLSNNSPTTT